MPDATPLSFNALAVGAFSFSAALAWNDFARAAIEYVYPDNTKDGVKNAFIYAVSVTVMVLLLMLIIRRVERLAKQSLEAWRGRAPLRVGRKGD